MRALLLGAAAMTKRFLEEPFERNPVLQFAAVNYLMAEECGKPIRVFSIWSRKLEAVAHQKGAERRQRGRQQRDPECAQNAGV